MSHYYDRHGDVGNNIDESGYMQARGATPVLPRAAHPTTPPSHPLVPCPSGASQEAELVDTYKTNRKMLKRMKKSLGICIEKYKARPTSLDADAQRP